MANWPTVRRQKNAAPWIPPVAAGAGGRGQQPPWPLPDPKLVRGRSGGPTDLQGSPAFQRAVDRVLVNPTPRRVVANAAVPTTAQRLWRLNLEAGARLAIGLGTALRYERAVSAGLIPAVILGWAVQEYFQPSYSGEPGRDPYSDNDMEIAWPPNWNVVTHTWPSEGGGIIASAIEHKDGYGRRFLIHNGSSSNPWNCSNTVYGPHKDDELLGVGNPAYRTHNWVVDAPFPGGPHQVTEFVHWSAQEHHPGVIFSPSSHGFRATWTATKLGGDATPTWANAPEGDPVIHPGGAPLVEHVPLSRPWSAPRTPNPFLSPTEQSTYGPQPGEITLPGGAEVAPTPVVHPPIIPGVPVVPGPVSPTPRQPPGPGTSERKVRLRYRGVVRAIRFAVGTVTEYLDVLAALYGALPKQYRPGYYRLHRKDGSTYWVKRWNPSVIQRAEAVWKHLDKIDMTDALGNIVQNEIEDQLIGRANRSITRNLPGRGVGSAVGFGAGPADLGGTFHL